MKRVDFVVGLLASIGSVVVVSAAIELLHSYVPVLSLGVLYVFAVLPIAVAWGLGFAVAVSIASMLAFNWFFLPPKHTLQLRDGANWLALAVYLVTAVVVSALAARARRRQEDAEQRRREAAVLAEAAGDLLRGVELTSELEKLADLAADALGVRAARIELGAAAAGDNEDAVPVEVALRRVATLIVPAGDAPDAAVAQRFLPALAALLAVAVDRAALEAEALEAEALRRSDVVKTALLRAVSHDLRSPLTAIVASADALASDELQLARRRPRRARRRHPGGGGASRPRRREPPRRLASRGRCDRQPSRAVVGGRARRPGDRQACTKAPSESWSSSIRDRRPCGSTPARSSGCSPT